MGQISLSSSLCTRLKAHQKPKGVKRSSPPLEISRRKLLLPPPASPPLHNSPDFPRCGYFSITTPSSHPPHQMAKQEKPPHNAYKYEHK